MNYELLAKTIRKTLLTMHCKGNASHIGSSFSCIELLITLYFEIMNIDQKKPFDNDRDKFILSKGHAASALYAVLAEKDFFDKGLLDQYYQDGGCLPGHSMRHCVPGVEVSTGSLGHGLPIGVGMAVANKFDRSSGRVFVLMSDGECNEGSVWEAAMFAAQHKLDNLVAVVDYNKIQAFGHTKDVIDLEPFRAKWEAFGWYVAEGNGHNIAELIDVFKDIPHIPNRPTVVIAHTVKGKGVSFMENKVEWHYRSPSVEQCKIAIEELGEG